MFTAALHYTKITCQSERVGAAVVFGFSVDGHCCVSVCTPLFVCAAVAVSNYSAVLCFFFSSQTHTCTICTSCSMKLKKKKKQFLGFIRDSQSDKSAHCRKQSFHLFIAFSWLLLLGTNRVTEIKKIKGIIIRYSY